MSVIEMPRPTGEPSNGGYSTEPSHDDLPLIRATAIVAAVACVASLIMLVTGLGL